MPIIETTINNTAWTLIGNNVTTITFQNKSQFPVYIAVTATNVAPTGTVGLIYDSLTGELKIPVADLTLSTLSGGAGYVWARGVRVQQLLLDQ
jgi:hypothetical protein